MLTRACSVFVKVPAMAMLVITAVGAGCGGGSGNKTGTGGTTSAAGGSSFSTGGQGGGDGGSGGTGGSGNGGTHTTGGAAGGATGGTYATGGTGGDLSMDPTEVCRAAIQAQAERMTACLGQDTVDSYMRSAQACPEYVFNPDSNRTVQDVADCLPALLARTCTDVAAAVMPACYANGKRDSGAGCAFASQCKNGVCNGGGQSCGVCYAGGKPAGSACQFWYECAVGLHCTYSGHCADNGSPVYAAEGQPCDLDATPIAGCVGDLYCNRSGTDRAGTCIAPPGAGEACAGNGMANGMGSSTICAAGTACVQGTCQLPGGCGAGLQCDSASYCASTGSGLACAPRASVGQGCSGGTSGYPCVAPAICLDYVKCGIPRVAGEACDADNPCDRYLICMGGPCQKMVAATCPA